MPAAGVQSSRVAGGLALRGRAGPEPEDMLELPRQAALPWPADPAGQSPYLEPALPAGFDDAEADPFEEV